VVSANGIVVDIHIRISIAVATVGFVCLTLDLECRTSYTGVCLDLHTSDRHSQLYFTVSAGLFANLLLLIVSKYYL
jgi:hypothetical protein